MELLSPHARTRMQQRGIRADALGCLLDYGSESPSTGGRVLVHFDKAAQRRLEREADEATRKQMSRLAKIYLVVAADGTVVAVGHRYKRIQRH